MHFCGGGTLLTVWRTGSLVSMSVTNEDCAYTSAILPAYFLHHYGAGMATAAVEGNVQLINKTSGEDWIRLSKV